jgi:hypothetical protein
MSTRIIYGVSIGAGIALEGRVRRCCALRCGVEAIESMFGYNDTRTGEPTENQILR